MGTIDIEVPLDELSPSVPSPDSSVTTVSARLYYPCKAPEKSSVRSYWFPGPQSDYFAAYLKFLGASSTFANVISYFPRMLYNIALPAHTDAPVLQPGTTSGRWPTMIFSHGLGGTRNMYSYICGSIASHGVVVIAPEHRDGSAPVSFIRNEEGRIVHTVAYQSIPHQNTDATQLARNSQLKQRLWEMGESYNLSQKLDKGVIFSNHTLTKKERAAGLGPKLSMFQNLLDVQRPGSVQFAGHSFGAVTALQFLKSVFYDPADAPATYQPLYRPPRASPTVRQVTAKTSLTLLDCWMLPTLDPSTAWLHDRPLPAYSTGGSGGKAILAVLSEGFTAGIAIGRNNDVHSLPSPRLIPAFGRKKGCRPLVHLEFSIRQSVHLGQSDFGILFPWLAKKAFKSEEPERTITLNTRAILEVWRNNGAEVADTSRKNMEVIEDVNALSDPKEPLGRKSSDDTLTGSAGALKQDEAILLRDGNVKGWLSLGLGDELVVKTGGEEEEEKEDVSPLARTKDAGRILKERVQNGVAA